METLQLFMAQTLNPDRARRHAVNRYAVDRLANGFASGEIDKTGPAIQSPTDYFAPRSSGQRSLRSLVSSGLRREGEKSALTCFHQCQR